jgi:hypothetical protein
VGASPVGARGRHGDVAREAEDPLDAVVVFPVVALYESVPLLWCNSARLGVFELRPRHGQFDEFEKHILVAFNRHQPAMMPSTCCVEGARFMTLRMACSRPLADVFD